MISRRVSPAHSLVLLAPLASPAFAAPEPGRFSRSVLGAYDKPLSGDVHDGATVAVPDLGPLNPALAGVDAELRIESRDHDEIYGAAMTVGLELGYGLSDRGEVFLQARENSADDGRVRVGTAYVPALDTELDVFGEFSDYDANATHAQVAGQVRFPWLVRWSSAERAAERRTMTAIDELLCTLASALEPS
jgi:hypothetical protein